jgi:hypothetical protein
MHQLLPVGLQQHPAEVAKVREWLQPSEIAVAALLAITCMSI